MLAGESDQAIVRQIPGCGYDQVRGRVHRTVVRTEAVRIESLDSFLGAENRLAQGMVLPEIGRKDLMDQVVRAIRLHFDLFEDDTLLFLDIFFAEQGMQDEVGQNIEG